MSTTTLEMETDSGLRRATTIAIATLANLAVWLLANWLLGSAVQIVEPGGGLSDLGALPIIAATVVSATAGVLFVALAARHGRARQAAIVVAILTLASLGAPLMLDVGVGSKIALSSMHIIAGGAVIALAVSEE